MIQGKSDDLVFYHTYNKHGIELWKKDCILRRKELRHEYLLKSEFKVQPVYSSRNPSITREKESWLYLAQNIKCKPKLYANIMMNRCVIMLQSKTSDDISKKSYRKLWVNAWFLVDGKKRLNSEFNSELKRRLK